MPGIRDLLLVATIFVGLILTLRLPFVGILLWIWFSIMNPHQEAFGFSHAIPLNFILALTTMGAWFFSSEHRTPPQRFLFLAILGFLVWTTFNSFFAVVPDWSWQFWDRTWKIFALGLLVAASATTKVRVHATIWVIVISLFYYGVKGGLFTLLTGGGYHVIGPEDTIISDNNQLALALLMSLPLANYLRLQSANKIVSVSLLIGMILSVVAVVGTYSRGGALGLAALLFAGLFRVKHKIAYAVIATLIVGSIFYFMPESFFDRLSTISNASDDASFQGRVIAWQVAFFAALDHFPFGVGFYGPQLPQIFNGYFPNEVAHAAHSIYFQVLGEHGFIGFALYIVIIAAAFMSCSRIQRAANEKHEFAWARDLAVMIQICLFVFCVAGAALSMAYYDVFVICVCLLLPLEEMILAPVAKKAMFSPPSAALQAAA
jgi:putative inorganic carbon (HCO3(-)) transporter